MANTKEEDNPQRNFFADFIETLDFSEETKPDLTATIKLKRLQEEIALYTEVAIEKYFEGEHIVKINQLVRDGLREKGFQISVWDEYELGLYTCVLITADSMLGSVIIRQFNLINDSEAPLNKPDKSIRIVEGVIPGFDMHVVAEYPTAIIEPSEENILELSRLANESMRKP